MECGNIESRERVQSADSEVSGTLTEGKRSCLIEEFGDQVMAFKETSVELNAVEILSRHCWHSSASQDRVVCRREKKTHRMNIASLQIQESWPHPGWRQR